MKLFWSILLGLLTLAAVVLLRPGATAPPRPPFPPRGSYTVDDSALKPDQPVTPSDFTDEPTQSPPAPAPEPAVTPTAATPTAVTTSADSIPSSVSDPSGSEIALTTDLNSLLGLDSSTESSTDSAAATSAAAALPEAALAPPEPAPSVAAPSEPPGPAPSTVGAAVSEIVPMRSKPGEDGWTILDERFPIRGAGTEDDPYEVSWELLVSASETYQPRLGKTRLPERIALLNGKHVRVTGYIAFPVMAMEQNELLSMRSMWDGCCIGVPPTPYDAIEVKLKNAATGKDRFTAFGVLEGLFKVDPYVKGNWLLGLYMMEQAQLKQTKEIDAPKPTHEPL